MRIKFQTQNCTSFVFILSSFGAYVVFRWYSEIASSFSLHGMTGGLSLEAMHNSESIFCFHVAHLCLGIWEEHLLKTLPSKVRTRITNFFTKLSKLKDVVRSHIRTMLLGQEGVTELPSPVIDSEVNDVDDASKVWCCCLYNRS